MKILALIPARGGSKRLPGKNIKLLGGIPLIAWTIKAALESQCCVDVLVSTDDEEIANIAIAYGAKVPWMRPQELASDTASSVDVAIHALDAYESKQTSVDGLMLLQPTSPFRSSKTVKRGVALFEANKLTRPVVSVSPAHSHPAWCFRMSKDGMAPFLGWDELKKRSQDLEPAWMLTGAFYLAAPDRLRLKKSFITLDTVPLKIEAAEENLDIDTMDDWILAENIVRQRLGYK